jgi:CDP-diglyceride synthetase
MIRSLAQMYVTLMPAILAGILNMAFCKLPIFKRLASPMDGGRRLRDGHFIFGANKTWKGFVGYLLWGTLGMFCWGALCGAVPALEAYNLFYFHHENVLLFNLASGALIGLAYALFELPNSFLKRRIGIKEGTRASGFKGIFFVVLDQADSIIGCILLVALFCPINVGIFFAWVAVGAATHLALNFLLWAAKLRRHMF